jgi:hypothetical protein
LPPERPLERRRARAVWRVAQAMFAYTAFNGPVEAWDVGQVTRMDVRRQAHVARAGGEGLGWLTRGRYVTTLQHALSVRVRCRGSENVPYERRFRPARGSVGRWSGHQNGCAPPPMPGGVVAGGALLPPDDPHLLCACGDVCAGNVLPVGRFQPACGSVGRWSGHQNGCAPRATCVRSQKRG